MLNKGNETYAKLNKGNETYTLNKGNETYTNISKVIYANVKQR